MKELGLYLEGLLVPLKLTGESFSGGKLDSRARSSAVAILFAAARMDACHQTLHTFALRVHLGMHNLKGKKRRRNKSLRTLLPGSAEASKLSFHAAAAALISRKATPSDGVDFQYRPDKTCLKFGIIIFMRMCVTNSDYARHVGRGERSLRPRILTYFADISSRV